MTILHGANAPNVELIEASGVPHKALEPNSRWDKHETRFIRREIIDTDPDFIHMFTNRARRV